MNDKYAIFAIMFLLSISSAFALSSASVNYVIFQSSNLSGVGTTSYLSYWTNATSLAATRFNLSNINTTSELSAYYNLLYQPIGNYATIAYVNAMNNLSYLQISTNIGNWSADRTSYATITYVNAINNVSLSTIQARIDANGNWTLDKVNYATLAYVNAINNISQATVQALINANGNYSADKAGLYANISTALTIAGQYYPNISGLQNSNITTNLRIDAINNSLSNYATITYVNAINNVSLATIQARIDANGNWTLDKVNYATLAYVNALNNVSQATIQALINANGNYSQDKGAIYLNISALQASNSNYYTNISTAQNSINSLVLNLSSVGNYSQDKNSIYINITALQSSINNYYPNLSTAQNSIASLVLNLSSVGNYSADKAGIYANISSRGSGNITGNITAGYIPYSFNGSLITNSNIFQNGGNIGIGTTSPIGKLEIKGGNNDALFINNDGSQYTSSYWENNGNIKGGVQLDNTDNNFRIFANGASTRLSLGTQATDYITISTTGNVGIGTTGPSQKLDVNGNALIQGGSLIVGSSTGVVYLGTPSNNYIYYDGTNVYHRVGGSDRITILNGGNIGIGTTNPTKPLTVVGKIGDALYADSYLQFPQDGSVKLVANNNLALGYAQDVVVTNSGNVGIGITSPTSKLQVFSETDTTSESTAFVVGSKNTGYQALSLGVNTAGTYSYLQSTQWATGYKPLSLNPNGGNIGVGKTSPSFTLDVAGTINATTYLGNGASLTGVVTGTGTAGNLSYWTNSTNLGTTTMTYSNLFLGINTTSPNATLHIVGTQKVDGQITVSRASSDSTALNLMANETEGSVKIVFWATPDATSSSDRVGQITAHGNLSGSTKDEMAWYMIDSTGAMDNRLKLLAGNDSQKELILTGATGIARSSAGTITMGESVLGAGTSKVNFKNIIVLDNGMALKSKDSGATERTITVLDSSNDLYFKNEATNAGTPRIFIQNRNAADVLTTRVRISEGTTANVSIQNSNFFVENGNTGLNTTSPTQMLDVRGNVNISNVLYLNNYNYGVCNSAQEGAITYNSTAHKFYGCNSTSWNAIG